MAVLVSSVVSKTTVIRGHVRGEGQLQIQGQVHGNVEVTGDVEVTAGAQVVGNVSGARLSIAGTVEGDLTATEAVQVEATGRIKGDLHAARVGIVEGALVRGMVQTEGVSTAPRSPQAARRPETVQRSARAEPPRTVATQAVENRPKPKPAPRPVEVPEVRTGKKKTGKRKPPPAPVMKAPRRGAKGKKRSTRG